MKVIKTTAPEKVEAKNTLVGEIYIFDGSDHAYFRHQTGLTNLETGANQPLETVVGGKRFTHCPSAVLNIE